jgi:hypothetical protein
MGSAKFRLLLLLLLLLVLLLLLMLVRLLLHCKVAHHCFHAQTVGRWRVRQQF